MLFILLVWLHSDLADTFRMFHSPSSDTIGIHLGTWKSLHGNIVLFSALHTVRNMGILLSDISCRPCTSVPALLAYDCLTTDAFPDNDPCMDLPVLCDRHNTLRRDIAPTSSRGSNNTGNHCRSSFYSSSLYGFGSGIQALTNRSFARQVSSSKQSPRYHAPPNFSSSMYLPTNGREKFSNDIST